VIEQDPEPSATQAPNLAGPSSEVPPKADKEEKAATQEEPKVSEDDHGA
jgi:hypothetical protein